MVVPFEPGLRPHAAARLRRAGAGRRPRCSARRLRPRLRLRPWPQGDAGNAALARRRVRFRLHLRAGDQGRGGRAVLRDTHPRLPAARPARRCRPAARPAVRGRERDCRGRSARPDARLSHGQPEAPRIPPAGQRRLRRCARWREAEHELVYPAVANLGLRPTFGGGAEPLLEAHLFDFAGDLYDRSSASSSSTTCARKRSLAGRSICGHSRRGLRARTPRPSAEGDAPRVRAAGS